MWPQLPGAGSTNWDLIAAILGEGLQMVFSIIGSIFRR